MKYRNVQALSLAVAVILVCLSGAQTSSISAQQSSRELIVTGPGGLAKFARAAYDQPFEKQYGIKVLRGSSVSLEVFEAQAKTGHPDFDVADADYSSLLIEESHHLLEPIDTKHFDPADLAAIPSLAKSRYGIGAAWFSSVLVYNEQIFPSKGPKSWADFWDVKKFPGKRALPACDYGEGSAPDPEVAVLAAGVPTNRVYPIDISLALKKLKELAPHVIWWRSQAQAAELLVSHEVSMALMASDTSSRAIASGAPLRIVWNQSKYNFNMWRVVRGARDKDNAMRYLAFVSRPGPAAAYAQLTNEAPSNVRALKLLPPELARNMPTSPENLKVSFPMNDAWWQQNRAKWDEACLNTVGR